MSRSARNQLVGTGFDYSPLDAKVAERVRTAAGSIREAVKKTMEDLIAVGDALRAVKELLPHGQFLPWLKAEFGWSKRMAENLMAVAERFGGKSATVAHLPIEPTAAYLLSAPSVPDQARQAAIRMARAGEPVTGAVAREIVGKLRKRERAKPKATPLVRLRSQLLDWLERCRKRCNPRDFSYLAKWLREYADQLEHPRGRRHGSSGI